MAVLMFWYLLCSLFAAGLTSPMPQAPNTVAFQNPKAMTWSDNGTTFIIPIDRAKVQSLVKYPLLTLPNDTSIFPMPFPQGKHPVVCRIEYENQIRLFSLSITCLLGAICGVPWVQRIAGSTIPFGYPLLNLLGGCSSDDDLARFLEAIVPVLVGNLAGNPLLVGTFDPPQAAYSGFPGGTYSTSVNAQITPPLIGPSLAPSAIQMNFQSLASSGMAQLFTLHTFDVVSNQPTIIETGQCVRNNEYANETFANPEMRVGNLTLSTLTTGGILPGAVGGRYMNVQGLSSTREHVGQVAAEDCTTAAMKNDPAANM